MSTLNCTDAYERHGDWTDPGDFRPAIGALPNSVASLACAVRGLLVHSDFLDLYGLKPSDFASISRETLPVAARLEQIFSRDPAPLSVERTPAKRPLATCRDYALVLCAFLREKRIPARVRCGFATYFTEGRFEDHWVCEYWSPHEGRWCMADAQLDDKHRAHLSIEFDTVDLPEGKFLPSGEAWQAYRSGAADGMRFGHGNAAGPWFLIVNLARDALALRKREVSDWDAWREALPWSRECDAATLDQGNEISRLISIITGQDQTFEAQHAAIENALTPFWSKPA
jgi:hypothetical protein